MAPGFLRLGLAATITAAVLGAQAPAGPDDIAGIRKAFDSAGALQALRCEIRPVQPKLTFRFRFRAGYLITIPLSQYRGTGHQLQILARVTPQGREPVYLSQVARLPDVPETKAKGEFTGEFVAGEGEYEVALLVRDESGRGCQSKWHMQARRRGSERQLREMMPAGSVHQIAAEERVLGAESPRIGRLTVLLHAAPLIAGRSKLEEAEVERLVGSVQSLLEQLPPQSLRVVVFNVEQGTEILSKQAVTPRDLPEIAEALRGVQLSKVRYDALKNPHRAADLMEDLLRKELQAAAPPDAVIVLGPPARVSGPMPAQWPERPAGSTPLFYFRHQGTDPDRVLLDPSLVDVIPTAQTPASERGPRVSSMRFDLPGADPIGLLVRRWKGETLVVKTSRDFADAIQRVAARVPKSEAAPPLPRERASAATPQPAQLPPQPAQLPPPPRERPSATPPGPPKADDPADPEKIERKGPPPPERASATPPKPPEPDHPADPEKVERKGPPRRERALTATPQPAQRAQAAERSDPAERVQPAEFPPPPRERASASSPQPPEPDDPADPEKIERKGDEDPTDVLVRLRDQVLSHARRVPNYTCIETVERDRYGASGSLTGKSCDAVLARRKKMGSAFHLRLESKDRLRLDVAYNHGKEIYSWAGASRFEEKDLDEWIPDGAIGTGPFASSLLSVFEPRTADFTFLGEIETNGRRLMEYGFAVPVERSNYRVKAHRDWIVTGYTGSLQVDPRTAELVRMTVLTEELPPETNACEVDTVLDYGLVQLGNEDYLLPKVTRQRFIGTDGDEGENAITFSACREYRGESSIRFGDGAGANRASAEIRPVPLELPAGEPVTVELTSAIRTSEAAAGDRIEGRLVSAVGALPAGAKVEGRLMRVEKRFDARRTVAVALRWERVEAEGSMREWSLTPKRAAAQKVVRGPFGLQRRGAAIELPQSGEERYVEIHAAGDDAVIAAGTTTEWIIANQ